MKRALFWAPAFLAVLLLCGNQAVSTSVLRNGPAIAPQALPAPAGASGHPPSAAARLEYGRLPMIFMANRGQLDPRVLYYVPGKEKSLYFTSEGLTLTLNGASERWAVKLDFVGANPAVRPEGVEETDAVVSYFKGQPDEWKTGLPTYSKVVYRDLWPGIDLVYAGADGRLKYEFIVSPGSDPSWIRLAYSGADRVVVNDEGRLEVTTPAGSFTDGRPVAIQEAGGGRKSVEVAYVLEDPATFGRITGLSAAAQTADLDGRAALSVFSNVGDSGQEPGNYVYGFEVGPYDRSLPFVIDPAVLIYCGYLGGAGIDQAFGIAVDTTGNAYITGTTYSLETSFPETAGPDLTFNGGQTDAFVAKVNAAGTALVYCGYIGGSSNDSAYGIAVDGTGAAYVAGYTASFESSFPVTVGPDLVYNSSNDAFVAKINSSGTALVYCGYIGGSSSETASGIAVNSSGNAIVVGYTQSTAGTFPEVGGPDLSHNGDIDAFIAKVNASGSALSYCGYIGGDGYDTGRGVAVDGSGAAYITGTAASTQTTFPETGGPDLTHNGGYDAFVAKVNSSGTLVYCGYVGGSDNDEGRSIAVDASGSAYLTGNTLSTETTFPETMGPDLTHNGGQDAFIAKVNSAGTALAYCGFLGGWNYEYGNGIAVDGSGSVYLAGQVSSSQADFPVTVGPDLTYGGVVDGFVAKLNPAGTKYVYCGYLGGSASDKGNAIALDSAGNAYIAGETQSTEADFPVKAGPDLTQNGDNDAFIARVSYWDIWHPTHAVGDFDGDGADEAALDFGASGAWLYDDGSWKQLTPYNPEGLVAANIDGDRSDELLGDMGYLGLYSWDNDAWSPLSGANIDGLAAGDIDGDGVGEVAGDFGPGGLWIYDDGVWKQASGVNADYVAAASLAAFGDEEFVVDFGAVGLWRRTTVWTQLSGVNADYVTFGRVSTAGTQQLFGDFAATGLWQWTGGVWTQLSGVDADYMIASDVDGSGGEELFVDFGTTGLWRWDGAAWAQLSNINADFMIGTDLNNDGEVEVIGDFGTLGIWLWGGAGWTQLSAVNPENMMAGDFDGDTQAEIMADFGTLGVYLWDSGVWSQVSANNPE
jgi:hypothetical protein